MFPFVPWTSVPFCFLQAYSRPIRSMSFRLLLALKSRSNLPLRMSIQLSALHCHSRYSGWK